jgi:transcriptional regulator with GAF, ATPase, and Fis domain
VRLVGVAAHWGTLHMQGQGLQLRVLGTGEHVDLVAGSWHKVDGPGGVVELRLEPPAAAAPPLDQLAEQLAGAETADEALVLIVDGVLALSGADVGAVVLTERGELTVACARDARGQPLPDAAALLSDTIITDVLASGTGLSLDDVAASGYAAVRSVVQLGLSSVTCLPLRLGGKALGAVFLAASGRTLLIPPAALADLKVVASLALPFVAQVRRRAAAHAAQPGSADLIVGTSAPIEQVKKLVTRVAPTELSVLLSGPSGSGKEVVARALHARSGRAARPLVAINCAAIAPSLLDAELFGYRKGAFTGALADRAGLIEAADGGTLFLDEIGDMPLAMQAALLRVLEQREVRRLGDLSARRVDFRLVAASHRDLPEEVAAGRFREDLFFRIQEVRIELPPLAARGDDVLLLGTMFLRQAEAQLGLAAHVLGDEAVAVLRAHRWPGNVRELKGAMRRAAIMADDVSITPEHLQLPAAPSGRATRPSAAPPSAAPVDAATPRLPLTEARDQFVRAYVQAALTRHGGNREAAARELGIGTRTIYRYLDDGPDPT